MKQSRKSQDIIIKDLTTNEEYAFLIASSGEFGKSHLLSGADNFAPKTQSGEMTYGDFTNSSVFAQANWTGQYNSSNIFIGPSGIKNWEPYMVYSNVLPTQCFWKSNGIDVLNNPGELRLGAGLQDYLSVDATANHIGLIGGELFYTKTNDMTLYHEDTPASNIDISFFNGTNVDYFDQYFLMGNDVWFRDELDVTSVSATIELPSQSYTNVEYDNTKKCIKVTLSTYQHFTFGQRVDFTNINSTFQGIVVDSSDPYIWIYPYNAELGQVIGTTDTDDSDDIIDSKITSNVYMSLYTNDMNADGTGTYYYFQNDGYVQALATKTTIASGNFKGYTSVTLGSKTMRFGYSIIELRNTAYFIIFNGAVSTLGADVTLPDAVYMNKDFSGGPYAGSKTGTVITMTANNYLYLDGGAYVQSTSSSHTGIKILFYNGSTHTLYYTGNLFSGTATAIDKNVKITQSLADHQKLSIHKSNVFHDAAGENFMMKNYYHDGTNTYALISATAGAATGTFYRFPFKKLYSAGSQIIDMDKLKYDETNEELYFLTSTTFYQFKEKPIRRSADALSGIAYLTKSVSTYDSRYTFSKIFVYDNVPFIIAKKTTSEGTSSVILRASDFAEFGAFQGEAIAIKHDPGVNVTYIKTDKYKILSFIYTGTSYSLQIIKSLEIYPNIPDITNTAEIFYDNIIFDDYKNGGIIALNTLTNSWVSFGEYTSSPSTAKYIIDWQKINSDIYFLIKGENKISKLTYDITEGNLVSSTYSSFMPGIIKNFIYAKVFTDKWLVDDGQYIQLQISFDRGDTFYYLPIDLDHKLVTTIPGGEEAFYKSTTLTTIDGKEHRFFFPFNYYNRDINYKIIIHKGTTHEPYVSSIEIHYLLVDEKEMMFNYIMNLNSVQEVPGRKIESGVHQKKLAFLKTIWEKDRVCKITHVDNREYYCIPFKPPQQPGGGIQIAVKDYDAGDKDDKDFSYDVTMSFKNIAVLDQA